MIAFVSAVYLFPLTFAICLDVILFRREVMKQCRDVVRKERGEKELAP
jgi:hypothetical protein